MVTLLPPGVFMTTMPFLLAASTSMFSKPTPARPMTFRFLAASIRSPGDFGAASDHPAIVVSDNLLSFIGFEADTNVYFEARRALEDFQSLRSQRNR